MTLMNFLMKSHLVNQNNKNIFLYKSMSKLYSKICSLAIILLLPIVVLAQKEIPNPMEPVRLVNDFVQLLTQEQLQQIENKLVAFDDSTGVQVTVVIVPTLDGYDKSDYAQRLGQKWGVGGKEFDNGFVILIKPKTSSERGDAFIATGYGVEEFVPDAVAWDIVNNEMIPFFKQNDYAGGINAATDAIAKFVSGEYKADKYKKSGKGGKSSIVIIIIIIIIVVVIFSNNNNNHHTISRGGGGTGPIFFPWTSGGGSSGGFGGFGGGGGSGGFGGFGGGSFGGGGAGGSW
jgi:uncharacterized protein